MTLKQLEAFYWAATCTTFAAAAERLHLSVSSLSKRIIELEQALGEPLFDRRGHRAVLTPTGARILPYAASVLRSSGELMAALESNRPLAGRCRFGVGELTALTWLPQFLKQAADSFPELLLELHIDVGSVLARQLEQGELDFAVIADHSARTTLLSYPIDQARFLWTASASLPDAPGLSALELLQHQPLITLQGGAGTTRILDEWFTRQQAPAGRRILCNGWGAVAGLLIDGGGIGFLPEGWVRALSRRGQLCLLDGKPELAPLMYFFQSRRDDTRLMTRTMRELVIKTADYLATSRLFSLPDFS